MEQVVDTFKEKLHYVAPGQQSIELSLDQNNFLVEKQAVSMDSTALIELRKLFLDLGINGLTIDKSVSQDHLQQFVKKLLSWRMDIEGGQGFVLFSSEELPKTIIVRQQEFLVGTDTVFAEDTDGDEEGDRTTVNTICENLSAQGLNESDVELCRELLVKISQPQQRKKIDFSAFPHATWHDVQALLVETFSAKPKEERGGVKADAPADINVISSIFESLGRGLQDEKSKKAIEILLTHLDDQQQQKSKKFAPSTAEKIQPRKQTGRRYDGTIVSLKGLNKFIYENSVPLKVLGKLTRVDRSEQLSIHLQLYISATDNELQNRLCLSIEALLSSSLSDRERQVLLAGLTSLTEERELGNLYTLLKVIRSQLRVHGPDSALGFFIELHDVFPGAHKSFLWPYLLNELLTVGAEAGDEQFFEATKRVSAMSLAGMASMQLYFQELDVCTKTNFSSNYFNPKFVFSYPLFHFLLDTSIGNGVAEHVLTQLIEKPQDKLIKIAGPILDIQLEEHLQFLKTYLLHAHHEEPPLSLCMAAGELIATHLGGLKGGIGSEENIEEMIASTSFFYAKGTEELLGEIIGTRKHRVLYLWPRKCRKAAKASLDKLQRKTVSKLI